MGTPGRVRDHLERGSLALDRVRVVALDDLRREALALASTIAQNGPLAVRAAKAAVWRGLDVPLAEGLRLEQLLAEPVRQSEDAQEGPRAFIEKRKPEFKGR